MTGIKNSPIPRRNEEIIAREVEREIYLCSPEGDQMHMLTDVAADLWRACDGQRSLGEITEWLLSRYDVDRATLTDQEADRFALTLPETASTITNAVCAEAPTRFLVPPSDGRRIMSSPAFGVAATAIINPAEALDSHGISHCCRRPERSRARALEQRGRVLYRPRT
jgi:hypothetical protein